MHVFRRFPATVIMGTQLCLLALLPAYFIDATGFSVGLIDAALVLKLTVLALFGLTLGQLLVNVATQSTPEPKQPGGFRIVLVARTTAALAICGWVLAITTGSGSIIESQTGAARGLLGTLGIYLTALTSTAIAFYALGRLTGETERVEATIALAVLTTTVIYASVVLGRLAIALPIVVLITVVAFIYRLFPKWLVVAGMVAASFVIPLLFAARNTVRLENVGSSRSLDLGAFDRLRQDTLISQLDFAAPSSFVDIPGPLQLIRFGLLPRFIDTARPDLDMSNQISIALGGSAQNSNTFSSIGNIYYFYGGIGLVMVMVLVGGLSAFAFHRFRTAGGAVVLCALVYCVFPIEASYPNSVVSFLQTLVLAMPFLLMGKWRTAPLSRPQVHPAGAAQSRPLARHSGE